MKIGNSVRVQGPSRISGLENAKPNDIRAFIVCDHVLKLSSGFCAHAQIAFEMMGALTVVTNCAIIALSPQLRDFYDVHGTLQVLAYIVIAEVRHQHSVLSSMRCALRSC